MKHSNLFKVVVLLSFILVTVIVIIQITSRQAQAITPPPKIQQSTAVARAIDIAHSLGLQEANPNKLAAKLMTLGDYDNLTGFKAGTEATSFGLDPDQQVWVVTIKGAVEWSGPGRKGTGTDKFDNITIVINAQTGRQLATFSAGDGGSLPVSVP